MNSPDDITRLEHILESAQEAISFLGDMNKGALQENRMALQAIVRSVEIIGEAAARISPTYRDNHPEILWDRIIGMRNRLVHAYFDIDYELVYSTVKTDLPLLIDQIRKLKS